MKKYTQKDFNALGLFDNFKNCPTGDYSDIEEFDQLCKFESHCVFGESRVFCEKCNFGDYCEFGSHCKFGIACKFGKGCRFSDSCEFKGVCIFSESCLFGGFDIFGGNCDFGHSCAFGAYTIFKEFCTWGDNCNYEDGNVVNGSFLRFGNVGSRNREVYLYIDKNEKLFLRAGCFFGDLDALKPHCNKRETDQSIWDEYLCIFESAKNIFTVRRRSLIKEGD